MKKSVLIILTALLSCACTRTPAYRDPSLSPEKRTADLLKRMTVEEKIGQLLCPFGWPMYDNSGADITYTGEYQEFIRERKGGALWGTFRADPWTGKTLENGLGPKEAAITCNMLQKYAMDSSRLGIPVFLAEEAPHGHMAIGATVFPTGISLASTWDTDLLEEIGRDIAEELRAVGAVIGYGPVIDLAREPRWSRVEETFGEDVFLTTEMAKAMVRGTSPKHNGWDKGVISTLKHFIAYGIPQGGHNGSPSQVGERDLRENFLPAFKGAIDEGALSVMTSYNSIDGIPSTANPKLLRKILKEDWGFEGFVVSDLVSIDGLYGTHHIAGSLQEAGETALEAGVDMDLGANCYALLKEDGHLDTKALDDAVRRVLLLKFRLGLFDNPYVDPEAAQRTVGSKEHGQTAVKAAREGVILLENNGILPLEKDMKVAVIGPDADTQYNQLGDYTAPQPEDKITTPLEGIISKIGKQNVIYSQGCRIRDTENENIAGATLAAAKADVIVAFVGGSSARDFNTTFKETGAAVTDGHSISEMECGEGFDRASLNLLGLQEDLLKALKKTGKPLVVVYIEGRPLDKEWASANADALLTQFYPGQAGGEAIADVLFGDYNPAGRLPVSVPKTVGQLPVYYNKPFPKEHGYLETDAEPLYAFGYGLSYTAFNYQELTCSREGNHVRVKATVTNTGKMDGDEVVQVYITDKIASTVRPRLQLRAFRRVHIPAGESAQVEFVLTPEAFSIVDADMKTRLESGEFIIQVGAASNDIRLEKSITL